MIRPLRRAHRGIVALLAVLLPVLFVHALRARILEPRVMRIPVVATAGTEPTR